MIRVSNSPALGLAAGGIAYGLLGIALTWPLVIMHGSGIAGDGTDPFQTLWGLWWWRYSFDHHTSPMFTRLLWAPDGAPLWFQTWDIPSAVAALPLWNLLPETSIYNFLIFATFPLSSATMYLFVRELWGSRLAGFLAGAIYGGLPYHTGHATANLHIASLQWNPLFLFCALKAWRSGRSSWFVFTGVVLGCATLASIYHLALCGIAAFILLLYATPAFKGGSKRSWLIRVTLVASGWLGTSGWLLIGMAMAYAQQPYSGAHDPIEFSADLLSFIYPNEISVWSGYFTEWRRWTGSQWSSASHVGLTLLGLSGYAWYREPRTRSFAGLTVIGLLLSLGPYLHVNGHVFYQWALPFEWLTRSLQILTFSGLPARFSWLVSFAVTCSAAWTLGPGLAGARHRAIVAMALASVVLVELWPHPTVITPARRLDVFEEWSRDQNDWIVLDASWESRALFHQVQHQHRIVGGYLSRTPTALLDGLRSADVLVAFFQRGDDAPVRPDTLAALRKKGVRFVIVDSDRKALAEATGLLPVANVDDHGIYRVPD